MPLPKPSSQAFIANKLPAPSPSATPYCAQLGGRKAEKQDLEDSRHFRWGRGVVEGGAVAPVLGSGRRSCYKAGHADVDISAGGRRGAAAAPVTIAYVPVSGRKPVGWQVTSAVRALRRTLLRAFRRPGTQALGSWRALGPAARIRGRSRGGVLVGCVPPPRWSRPSPLPWPVGS